MPRFRIWSRSLLVGAALCGCRVLALANVPTFTYIPYQPNAPVNNFNAPSTADNLVAYGVLFTADTKYIYGSVMSFPAGPGRDKWTGLTFSNLYFGTGANYASVSDFGLQVQNGRAFIPGGAVGPANLSSFGYVTNTVQGTSYPNGGNWSVITFALPWSYLLTDPNNLGFAKVSLANPNVELRLSQSFSQSVVGGPPFGPMELGVVTYTVPEPGMWVLLAGSFPALILLRRRYSTKL